MDSPNIFNQVPNEMTEVTNPSIESPVFTRQSINHSTSRFTQFSDTDEIQILPPINHSRLRNPNDEFNNFDGTGNGNSNDTVTDKLNIMSLNNSWNDKNERLIVSIGENAAAYKWMHEKNASHLKLIHKVLNILLVVFNTGLSAQTLIPQGDTKNEAITIVSQVFIYLVTLISVVSNFLKYEELSAKHMNFAMKFSELYHEIQQQMCMYRKDRKLATQYIQDTLKRFDEIVLAAPTIDNIIISQFKSTFKDSKTAVPTIADRLDNIEILTDNTPPPILSNLSVNSKNLSKSKTSNLKSISQLSKHDPSLTRINAFHIDGDITDNDL